MELPPELRERHFPEDPESILDVGCGIYPQSVLNARLQVGVDAFRPYLEGLSGHSGILICAKWRDALRQFLADSFDVVVALDFIEHLTRREGFAFLREAQRVGRQVLIFTPNGPFPQPLEETDGWGYAGGEWQTHRSAWTPKDFEGWDVFECPDFHHEDAHHRPLAEPIGAFWAVRTS